MKGKADGLQAQALQMGGRCLERSVPRDQQSAGLLRNLWSGGGHSQEAEGGKWAAEGRVGGNVAPAIVLQTACCLATSGFQVMLSMVDKDGLTS